MWILRKKEGEFREVDSEGEVGFDDILWDVVGVVLWDEWGRNVNG